MLQVQCLFTSGRKDGGWTLHHVQGSPQTATDPQVSARNSQCQEQSLQQGFIQSPQIGHSSATLNATLERQSWVVCPGPFLAQLIEALC